MVKGPVASRVLLGFELRELREAAGKDVEAVVTHTGWYATKIYRSERGEGALAAAEIDKLLAFYGASKATATRIRDIAAQARRRGSYGKVPDWSRQYFGLEQDATELRFHQGELVPGLFQTEAYARALISTSKTVAPADVDDVVQSRIRRRSLLTGKNPPEVHLVLGEAAIHCQVGGPEALVEQINHLIDVAKLPNVTLQLLPFAVGAHAALGDGFSLLTLEIGGGPSKWVYVSDLNRGECRADPAQVRTYQLTFDSLVVNALGEGETLARLRQTRDGLR
ncbi:helix-turn-helix transcriptional regulator [Amycolatopsis minnesotensis]|uniref:Helix-turn-helix transcriptional regulator n=1 Tax=Amycolatopsis minnesotensis TaxID=337894 RepID=A0ABP5C1A1_9PSEU